MQSIFMRPGAAAKAPKPNSFNKEGRSQRKDAKTTQRGVCSCQPGHQTV